MANEQITASATARLANINYTVSSIAFAGAIVGVVYSNRTGGGFWRGVGYFFLGSIAFGTVAKLVALPFENKIIKEGVVSVDL